MSAGQYKPELATSGLASQETKSKAEEKHIQNNSTVHSTVRDIHHVVSISKKKWPVESVQLFDRGGRPRLTFANQVSLKVMWIQ